MVVTNRYTRARPPAFRHHHVPFSELPITERDIRARLPAFRRRRVPFDGLLITEWGTTARPLPFRRRHVPLGGLLITERDMMVRLLVFRRRHVPFGGLTITDRDLTARLPVSWRHHFRGSARRHDSLQEASSHVRRRSLLHARRSARIGIIVGQATMACPLAFRRCHVPLGGTAGVPPGGMAADETSSHAWLRLLRSGATVATIVTDRYTRARLLVSRCRHVPFRRPADHRAGHIVVRLLAFRRHRVPFSELLITERDIRARPLAFRRRHVPFDGVAMTVRDLMAFPFAVGAVMFLSVTLGLLTAGWQEHSRAVEGGRSGDKRRLLAVLCGRRNGAGRGWARGECRRDDWHAHTWWLAHSSHADVGTLCGCGRIDSKLLGWGMGGCGAGRRWFWCRGSVRRSS